MKMKLKKLTKTAKTPVYGTEYSAGADLYADIKEEISFFPGETTMIPTGISIEIPEGYVGLVFARSGLAFKRGLAPANKVGVIDSDYRGEIKVALRCHGGDGVKSIEPGERIAQLVILPYVKAEFEEADSLDDTERGLGGFGSAGRM